MPGDPFAEDGADQLDVVEQRFDRRCVVTGGARERLSLDEIRRAALADHLDLEEHEDGDFYVRSGAQTVKLEPDSAAEYVRTRWA